MSVELSAKLCACGCGAIVNNIWCKGHHYRGVKRSDVSARMLKLWADPVLSAKLSTPMIGRRNWTTEQRAAVGNQKRGLKLSEGHRRAIGDRLRGKRLAQAHRAKIALKSRERMRLPENRNTLKLIMLARASHGLQLPATWQGTKPELVMGRWLSSFGVEFKTQIVLHGSLRDFVIPSLKLIIEVDGCYWHACPKHHPESKVGLAKRERDLRNAAVSAAQGWRVFRICEHDIKGRLF